MNDVHIHLGTAKHLLTQSVHYCWSLTTAELLSIVCWTNS